MNTEGTRQFLVIDLGGTHVRTAIADESGRLAGIVRASTHNSSGPDPVIQQIAEMSRRSLDDGGVAPADVCQAVVASPGPLDPDSGMVFSPPNMAGWDTVPLRHMLESRLSVPVRIVNDANAGAMGEYVFGAARGARLLVYFTVSTGIGGGVVIDGHLLEGVSGTAAELGHMTIDRHAPLCMCGNIGCLESISSGTSIARSFNRAVDAGRASSWTGQCEATAADVARMAGEGDGLAVEIFGDAADALGTGVVNAIHVFNPDVVVLGGGVTQAGDLLFDPVRAMVQRYAMPMPAQAVRIVRAALGDDVGLMGAAAVALQARSST